MCLLWCKGLHLFPLLPGSFDGLGYVARDEAIVHRLLERLVQEGVYALHRGRRKPRCDLLSVKRPYVGRRKKTELDVTKCGNKVDTRQPFVALVRSLLHRAFHTILQPAVQVPIQSQVLSIEDYAAVSICCSLPQ